MPSDQEWWDFLKENSQEHINDEWVYIIRPEQVIDFLLSKGISIPK